MTTTQKACAWYRKICNVPNLCTYTHTYMYIISREYDLSEQAHYTKNKKKNLLKNENKNEYKKG